MRRRGVLDAQASGSARQRRPFADIRAVSMRLCCMGQNGHSLRPQETGLSEFKQRGRCGQSHLNPYELWILDEELWLVVDREVY